MKLYIPSTSRSDVPNTDALRRESQKRGHELASDPGRGVVAILLGDRSEMLTEARRCVEGHTPWVHVGAGCITKGSWDQTVRDMLEGGATKVWPYTGAAWDLVASRAYQKLGGGAWDFGVPVLDHMEQLPINRDRESFVLVALNPVTAGRVGEELHLVRVIQSALLSMDALAIWSKSNEDPQGETLNGALERAWLPDCRIDRQGLSFDEARALCRCVVGNSSSAPIECSVLGVPFVDCGTRQAGRPLSMGLTSADKIRDAILESRPFAGQSPYQHYKRNACGRIIDIAEEI